MASNKPDSTLAGATGTYWARPTAALLSDLQSGFGGLSAAAAAERLRRQPRVTHRGSPGRALARRVLDQLMSPLVLILIFGALIALATREWIDAGVVLSIILLSAFIGATQEYRASRAVDALRRRVSIRASVLREGRVSEIPADQVVPGDILKLSAGSVIAADGVLLEANDFFVAEALLTGETFPVEKQPGTAIAGATLSARGNCIFAGTSVRSGTATAVAVHTGPATEFGRIQKTLSLRPPDTEFERGLRHFGNLLLQVMTLVVLAVLAVNILLHRPTPDTLMFAVALAVGLSPELLPAILAITQAKGAQRMARVGVIVRQLNAIENLGSMDVLCTDKTGTLTRGVVELDGALDVDGHASVEVMHAAYVNAVLQTGMRNALDEAVVAHGEHVGETPQGLRKLDEVPYDFVRKCLSVAATDADTGADGAPLLVTKGAFEPVLALCTHLERGGQRQALEEDAKRALRALFEQWSGRGYRVLGVARKVLQPKPAYDRNDEHSLSFIGFLLFLDPPEPGVKATLQRLRALGVNVKMVTGDNRLVARHIAEAVGLGGDRVLTGADLASMKDEALWNLAPQTTVFAEVDPNQKERIITALQKSGCVVGYLGDGINDAPALHAADVGISVDQAVDVAKEAADIVLLRHDLEVLRDGIDEGRHTFANTLKYIFITTSANFGNMISMALATVFLPFLPLLAKQILLNNFLSDIPAVAIAGDNVDREWASTPHRWDIGFVRDFMISFGLVSTVFDLFTFVVLVALADHVPELFRTGWFVESLLTELMIIFVVRTHRPMFRSRPARGLLMGAAAVAALTLSLPYLPFVADGFGLVPLPPPLLAAMLAISLLYAAASEALKHWFFRRLRKQNAGPPRVPRFRSRSGKPRDGGRQ